MFNRLKIKETLFLGFGVVLLLMLIIIGLGISKMAAINNDLTQIADNRYPKIELGNTAIKTTLDTERLVRSAVLYSSPSDIENTIAKIDANRKKNETTLSQLGALLNTAKGKELFAKIEEQRDALAKDYAPLYTMPTLPGTSSCA